MDLIREENKKKIDWEGLSMNTNDEVINLPRKNKDEIDWGKLSENNKNKINWEWLFNWKWLPRNTNDNDKDKIELFELFVANQKRNKIVNKILLEN